MRWCKLLQIQFRSVSFLQAKRTLLITIARCVYSSSRFGAAQTIECIVNCNFQMPACVQPTAPTWNVLLTQRWSVTGAANSLTWHGPNNHGGFFQNTWFAFWAAADLGSQTKCPIVAPTSSGKSNPSPFAALQVYRWGAAQDRANTRKPFGSIALYRAAHVLNYFRKQHSFRATAVARDWQPYIVCELFAVSSYRTIHLDALTSCMVKIYNKYIFSNFYFRRPLRVNKRTSES